MISISTVFRFQQKSQWLILEKGTFSQRLKRRGRENQEVSRISRRLVPLARSGSAPIDCSSHDQNRILLEQAFDDGMYQLKGRFLFWHSMTVLQFRCFMFQTSFLPILILHPSTRQVTSWSHFAVQFVLRRGQRFLTR